MDKEELIRQLSYLEFKRFVNDEIQLVSSLLSQFWAMPQVLATNRTSNAELFESLSKNKDYNLDWIKSCEYILGRRLSFLTKIKEELDKEKIILEEDIITEKDFPF